MYVCISTLLPKNGNVKQTKEIGNININITYHIIGINKVQVTNN